jgi:response regulator RpfG family c-di-GMP phosphodiesterase
VNNDEVLPHVLVVDDEAINRLLLVTALKKRGYLPEEAANGKDALEKVEQKPPDLILLDVMMPDLTGFDVCRSLKERKETADIPVILVTALHSREDIEEGIKAGADEFISKPVNINELMVRVRTLLKIRELNAHVASSGLLSSTGEGAAPDFSDSTELSCAEADHLIASVIEAHLAVGPEDYHRPHAVFVSLSAGSYECGGKLFFRTEGDIEEEDIDAELDIERMQSLGVWQEGMLMSNWQETSPSPEAYTRFFPEKLVEKLGTIRNFILYYVNDSQRILFLNFHRSLKLFDLTWYRHLGFYIYLLLLVFEKMGKKEDEYLNLVRELGKITEVKEGSEGKHKRIQKVCALLCNKLDCSSGYTTTLLDAVQLYDVSKLMIDQSILSKDGPLSGTEWALVRKAPVLASWVFHELPRLSTAREIAANLYERYDGTGYPLGRKGREIPFAARLVRVADIYESLRSRRSFRRPFSHDEAIALLRDGDDRLSPDHFDPEILRLFLSLEEEVQTIYGDIPKAT